MRDWPLDRYMGGGICGLRHGASYILFVAGQTALAESLYESSSERYTCRFWRTALNPPEFCRRQDYAFTWAYTIFYGAWSGRHISNKGRAYQKHRNPWSSGNHIKIPQWWFSIIWCRIYITETCQKYSQISNFCIWTTFIYEMQELISRLLHNIFMLKFAE